jgi:regulator of sigma E protease
MTEPTDPASVTTSDKVERGDWATKIVILAVLAGLVVWRPDLVRAVLTFVVTLGLLVFVHEWGHFIAARAVGVRAFEFALGFGKRLTTYWRGGGTEYTIRMLPLGGFVNLKGMQPENPISHDGINGRRPAERALVYLGGPLMNVVFGVAVMLLLGAVVGTEDPQQALVAHVERKSAASRMEVLHRNGQPAPGLEPGLRVGDEILEVNGHVVGNVPGPDGNPVPSSTVVVREINPNPGKRITLLVRRRGDQLLLAGEAGLVNTNNEHPIITAVPEGSALPVRVGDQLDLIDGRPFYKEGEAPEQTAMRILHQKGGQQVTLTVWRAGVRRLELTGPAPKIEVKVKTAPRTIGALGFVPVPGQGPRQSLQESVKGGLLRLQIFVRNYVGMFQKPKELGESVGGPIAIFQILDQAQSLPPIYFVPVVASLSLSLAIFNLFPIPVLDGGHMLLLTFEVLRRRRLEPEAQRAAQMVGLAIVLVLAILIFFKDAVKALG